MCNFLAMGCGPSFVEWTPRTGTGIGRERKEAGVEVKLMEKWTEFRQWVRHPRGGNTKVVAISIKPSESFTGAAVKEESDRMPTGNNKRIRPKAAKGKRKSTTESVPRNKRQLTYVEMTGDIEHVSVRENIPSPRWITYKGSVSDLEMKSMMDKMGSKMDQMVSKVHLPGAVEDDKEDDLNVLKHKTVIDSHKQRSRSFLKRILPKAVKGKLKRKLCIIEGGIRVDK